MCMHQVVVDEGDTLLRLCAYLLSQTLPEMPEHLRSLAQVSPAFLPSYLPTRAPAQPGTGKSYLQTL